MPIRVILADNQEIVRYGIKAFVRKAASNQIEIVGEAADSLEALSLCKKTRADVFLLKLTMPKLNGIDSISRLKEIAPKSKAIIFSATYDQTIVARAFINGAHGYLLIKSPANEIVKAIIDTYNSQFYVSPQASSFFVKELLMNINDYDYQSTNPLLTLRQREILKLICDGHQQKSQISKEGVKMERDEFDNLIHEREIQDFADQAEIIDDVVKRAALGLQDRERLRGILSALLKIENNQYGICETCGGQISKGRLEAIPDAHFCLACKKRHQSKTVQA